MILTNKSVSAVVSLIAAGIILFAISCDNPFSNNLGEKVDVAPPTISVTSPVSGDYLSGTAHFTGVAGAYRELRSVEVKIFANESQGQTLVDWTSEGITLSGDQKNKTWSFDLNTFLLNGGDTGAGRDGSIRMQFRAIDNSTETETIELIYIVKNNPSDIRMTAPSDTSLENETTPSIMAGSDIRGQITDRRGIKPGYPMIKIWPESYDDGSIFNEPDDDDTDWGYVSMFLPGVSAGGITEDSSSGTYADRSTIAVVRAAQFSFKMDKYTIDPETRQVKYEIDSLGDHTPLDSGKYYYFRIKTRDTFFDADTQIPNSDNEDQEIQGYFPHELNDPFTPRADAAKILLTSAEVAPVIEIDNTDITDNTLLENKPNIYITETNSKKIITDTPQRVDFRLRVLATHDDDVAYAELEWSHVSSGRSGFLDWTEPPLTANLTFTKGKIFTFEAFSGLVDEKADNKPLIFTSNSEPYTLTVNAYSSSGTLGSRRYTLYVDGEGPSVSVRSMRAYSEPASVSYVQQSGGLIFDSPYTVNGNILTSVDRSDDSGILVDEFNMPKVKWYVETIDPLNIDNTINPNSLLKKLDDYRTDPSADGVKFFDDISDTRTSGWVQRPDPNAAEREEQNNHFKFNTFWPKAAPLQDENLWHKSDLWLYIIAQDSVYNLGFALHKLSVDDDTDIPVINVPTLSTHNAAGKLIEKPEDLDVIVDEDYVMSGNWSTDTPRRNVLEKDQGIELNLTDDDGIARNAADIHITLTDLNGLTDNQGNPLLSRSLTTAQLEDILDGGSTEWSGMLDQQTMANVLYSGTAAAGSSQLRPGMYRIDIKVTDDVNAKIAITEPPRGNNPGDTPSARSNEASFYFAVYDEPPEVIIETPQENSLQNEEPISISGTVRSALKAQQLRITFTPDIITPNKDGTKSEKLLLYKDSGYTQETANLEDFEKGSDGQYTYYWSTEEISFDPFPDGTVLLDGTPLPDWRRFTLEVYDRVGNRNAVERTIQVDKTPPDAELQEFNYYRDDRNSANEYIVNGKVPFIIAASDDNGLEKQDGGYAGLRWWALPTEASDTNKPGWDTSFPEVPEGAGYQFLSVEDNNGRFTGILDTRLLKDESSYTIWAIARDSAGNSNVATEIARIYIDQASDYPELDAVNPQGTIISYADLTITGTASDDDGFNGDNEDTYVQIRFPSNWNSDGTPTAWSDNDWTNVDGTLNPTGVINFEYSFANKNRTSNSLFNGYFATDGAKYYQIRVTDEAIAGQNNRPAGKNPDLFKVGNPNFPGYAYTEAEAVSKIFPSDTGTYSFTLDSDPPVIYFDLFDPTPEHPNYQGYYPTYSNVDDLLKGDRRLKGTVYEANLSYVSLIYGAGNSISLNYSGDNNTWDLSNLSLEQQEAIADIFEKAGQGSLTITIEAGDLAGNISSVPWIFNKDTDGPEINPNISRVTGDTGTPAVVSGNAAGEAFITGSFFDIYSHIWNDNLNGEFYYRFNSGGETDTTTSWINGEITHTEGMANNRGNWSIPIPKDIAGGDGEHTFDIYVEDEARNRTTEYGLRFILDTAAPVLPLREEFKVAVSGLTPQAYATETERVFSAANTDPDSPGVAFTLSGTVSDNNLRGLTATISWDGSSVESQRRTVRLELGDTWARKPNLDWTDYEIIKSTDTEGRLTITPSSTPYAWDWTLDVMEKDIAFLRDGIGGLGDGRCYIAIIADDRDNRTAGANNDASRWYFSLDITPPSLESITVTSGDTFAYDEYTNINLRGTFYDSKKIKNIQFRIAKWDYTANSNAGAWTYWSNNAWSTTPPTTNPAEWPSLLNVSGYDSYNANDASEYKNWDLSAARLEVVSGPNTVPDEIFKTEGKYRLDLYVTDWSLGNGNPWYTDYNDTNDASLQKAWEFFVDRRSIDVTLAQENTTYFKSDTSGDLTFNITVGNNLGSGDIYNPNTITAVTAQINGRAGSTVTLGGTITINTTNATTDSVLGLRNYTVTVPMLKGDGSKLDDGDYTLTLTITNGANRRATKTKTFTLDNTAPVPRITAPTGGNQTIAGQMEILGNVTENGSLQKVGFYVANNGNGFANPPPTFNGNSGNGWYVYNSNDDLGIFRGNGTEPLMSLTLDGSSWNIQVPSISAISKDVDAAITGSGTRYAERSTAAEAASAGAALTWNGVSLNSGDTTGDLVYKLTVYVAAIDAAGNVSDVGGNDKREFWLYPEGDRPIVEIYSPSTVEVQSFNGEIDLSGYVTDNAVVRRVWFRAYEKGNPNNPITLKGITAYNPQNWNGTPLSSEQGQQKITVPYYGGSNDVELDGWYYAIGGGSPELGWEMTINTNGEFAKPDDITYITIEVVAEDTTSVQAYDAETGSTVLLAPRDDSMISRVQTVEIQVINNAPETSNEWIRPGNSVAISDSDFTVNAASPDPWGPAASTNVRKRAVYQITFSHETGLSAILWTPSADVLKNTSSITNTVNLMSSTAAYYSSGAYQTALDDINNDNLTGTGIAVKAVQIDSKSWRVIVDIHTELLKDDAGDPYTTFRYPLELTALDNTNPTPTQLKRTSILRIDNKPPEAIYTMNPRLVGISTVGGEAADKPQNTSPANLNVSGLSRVVVWFSRVINNADTPITLRQNSTVTAENTFEPGGEEIVFVNGVLTSISIPRKYDADDQSGNWSSIVIDRGGNNTAYGQTYSKSWNASATTLDMVWSADIDSSYLADGPITAHYMVYDKAGNASYYTTSLMVMNHAPAIRSIQLATDIRGDFDQTSLTGNATNGGNSTTNGFLNAIRTRVGGNINAGNAISGISEVIDISSGDLGMARQVDFNVRNRLLALRVETTANPDPTKERKFRLEYVSHANKLGSGTMHPLSEIKAGRVYVISEPGNTNWNMLGADNLQSYRRGLAFLAAVNGANVDIDLGTGSVWELNTGFYETDSGVLVGSAMGNLELTDVTYNEASSSGEYARAAEFAYKEAAFVGTGTQRIKDFTPRFIDGEFPNSGLADYPIPLAEENGKSSGWDISDDYSLFIVKVFDGPESDVYADFTLLAMRVNNDDATPPYAQLYDLNPYTERTENRSEASSLITPKGIGQNRTMGGLWNTDESASTLSKPGHIEPRGSGNSPAGITSLTSVEMGGAADPTGNNNRLNPGSEHLAKYDPTQSVVETHWANPASYPSIDTVSGKVVLRGYAEDDQRIGSIVLQFNNGSTTPILQQSSGTASDTQTGMLAVYSGVAGSVFFTDTITLDRHRVEWAYIWDTETLPADLMVGDVQVKVTAHNTGTTTRPSGTAYTQSSPFDADSPNNAFNGGAYAQPSGSIFNSSFPTGLRKYNAITVQRMPYISGFIRNNDYYNARSSQGWYAFTREETVVVTGFNLGHSAATTTISLPTSTSMVSANATQVTSASTYGLTDTNVARYRQFRVADTAAPSGTSSTPRVVRLYVDGYEAINTARPTVASIGGRPWIQPWNSESGISSDATILWEDYPYVHIWRSGNAGNGGETDNANAVNGEYDMFRLADRRLITDPAMSIDPLNGTLWASHSEGSGGDSGPNAGMTKISSNRSTGANKVLSFADPLINAHLYVSANGASTAADVWTVASLLGRAGAISETSSQYWGNLGGVWVAGPSGRQFMPYGDGSRNPNNNITGYNDGPYIYAAESTWYNASTQSTTRPANEYWTDQFASPHIVTHVVNNTTEHVHVSYYDNKDKSIKYRYNLRGNPTLNGEIFLNTGGGDGSFNYTNTNNTSSTANTTEATTTTQTNNIATANALKVWVNLDGGFDSDDTVGITGTGNNGLITATGSRVVNYATRNTTAVENRIDAGSHNAIAVTYEGYPVIAYYDASSQKLKLAVSNSLTPTTAANWRVMDVITDTTDPNYTGTGQYVSMRIDHNAASRNKVHISTFNANTRRLVYISGQLGNNFVWSGVQVQVVDSAGLVGKRSSISLDSGGNPWIVYLDERRSGNRGGAKVAFLSSSAYGKQLEDANGTRISGWETMTVPAIYRVEDERLGLENFPTRNVSATTNDRTWNAAISYLERGANDRYRIAYYIKGAE